MSTIIIVNTDYVKKSNILLACIKNNIKKYINIDDYTDIGNLTDIKKIALLWDNHKNSCFIPFFNKIKLNRYKFFLKKTLKQNVIKKKAETLKVRHCKNIFNTTRKKKFIVKKHTRNNSDVMKNKLIIKDASKDWSKKLTRNNKLNDNINKVKELMHNSLEKYNYEDDFIKYYSKNLLQLLYKFSQNDNKLIVDLISCNMNNKNFIKQTQLIEKKLNITIRYSTDETGKSENMGDWIQESHNVSIKTIYFNNLIKNWNYVLTSYLTNTYDDSNIYNITISGDDYYITDIDSDINTLYFIPEITYQSYVINITGFYEFDFKNNNNQIIDICGLNFTNFLCEKCDFSGVTFADIDLSSTTIKDSSLNNTISSNTTYGYLNKGGNYLDYNNDEKFFSRIINVNYVNEVRTYRLGKNINLTNVDLSNQIIDNIDFTNSNLTNAVLPSKNLTNARLCNFKGTPYNLPTLDYKQLVISDNNNVIIGPHLDITNINLSDKDLTGFNFSNCSLSQINLNNCNLSNIILNNTTSGPFIGTPSNLPNTNYNILQNSGNKFLVGSNVKINNVNFDTFNFDNIEISNIDLSKCILSNVTFNNSYIRLIKNKHPDNIPSGYIIIDQNIVGPQLRLGEGPYTDINFTINFAGHNISNTILNNCKIGGISDSNNLPVINNHNQYVLTHNNLHFIYGENFDCTGYNFSQEDLSNKTLKNANLTDAILNGTTINNTKIYNIIGTPRSLPNGYFYKESANTILGPNLNYEDMIINDNNLFKRGNKFYNIDGITTKNMTWDGYSILNNYSSTHIIDQYLPDEMKFVNGMIIGKNVNLKNTKVIRLKRNVELTKSVKYKFKSIVHLQTPYTLKIDLTESRTDISYVYDSTNEHPMQFIEESNLELVGATENQKTNFDLSYVIKINNAALKERKLEGVNLHTESLVGRDFSGSNLTNTDLSNTDLTGCNFTGTNLTNTDFSGSILTNVNFTDASFSNTNFTNTIDISTALFTINNTNSIIIFHTHNSQTLPDNISFTPDTSFNTHGTGILSVTNKIIEERLTLFDDTITNIIPGSVHYIDFSYNNTKYNITDLSFEIINSGTQGIFDKTVFTYNEPVQYNIKVDASNSDIIKWRITHKTDVLDNSAVINVNYSGQPSNNALIENVTKTIEINTELNFNFSGRNVNYFEITTKPLYGTLKYSDNGIIKNVNKNTKIYPNNNIIYTGREINTETLTFRALGNSGLYSENKILTIEVINEVLTSVSKKDITDKIEESQITVLTSINTNSFPSISIGDLLTKFTTLAERLAASKNYIRNFFATYQSLRYFLMSKLELGLSLKMLGAFKNQVRVINPHDTIVNDLPNLSEESLYCSMEEGEKVLLNFGGSNYTFLKTSSGTQVSPPINGRTDWNSDETTVLNNSRVIFGSVGVGENDAPFFTSSVPNTTIEIDATFTYSVAVDDANDDTITLTAPTLPDWLTFTDYGNGTGLLTGQAFLNDSGLSSVVIEASDGSATAQQTFDIFVKIPDLIIKEVGDPDPTWGNVIGKIFNFGSGSRYLLIENRDTISINLIYYKIGIYGTTYNSNDNTYKFNNTVDYIPLSGNLSAGNHLLLTLNSKRALTDGNNFEIAIGDPNFTSIIDFSYNFSQLTNTTLYNGFTGYQTIEILVNNGNNGDYVVDRFGIEPVNNAFNSFTWENKVVNRNAGKIPTQTFDTNDWSIYDLSNNSSQLLTTQGQDSILTFYNIISSSAFKYSGYYPLYKAKLYAYNHSGGNGSYTEYTFDNLVYFMPNGLTLNETYFLGNYDDPIVINGYWPLYWNQEIATTASPINDISNQEFSGITYYMPKGLNLGSTIFEGTYNDPFWLEGYYPLYRIQLDASNASLSTPKDTVTKEILGNTYYMPAGLTENVFYDGGHDEAISIDGYYPLYRTEQYAINNSPLNSAHTHTFSGVIYYMPNGLVANVTFFHGNYAGVLPSVPCLTKESYVKTPNGYVNITKLHKYDMVTTSDGRNVPITTISKTKIVTDTFSSPFIIPKNYFRKGYPPKKFKISSQHAIAVDENANDWFIPYIHGLKLEREKMNKNIIYYHIELPNWLTDNLVIDGGTVVESLSKSYHKKLGLCNTMYIEGRDGYYERDIKYYARKRREIKKLNETKLQITNK